MPESTSVSRQPGIENSLIRLIQPRPFPVSNWSAARTPGYASPKLPPQVMWPSKIILNIVIQPINADSRAIQDATCRRDRKASVRLLSQHCLVCRATLADRARPVARMRPGLRGREGACGAGRSMNPNSRRGTSPHRGAWVMDVETMTDRFCRHRCVEGAGAHARMPTGASSSASSRSIRGMVTSRRSRRFAMPPIAMVP